MATLVDDRIDVRISKDQKEMVKYASEMLGFKSLSEFVVYCINREAKAIINEHRDILKTLEDKKLFVEAILNPPVANEKLKNAQLKYKKFLENNEY